MKRKLFLALAPLILLALFLSTASASADPYQDGFKVGSSEAANARGPYFLSPSNLSYVAESYRQAYFPSDNKRSFLQGFKNGFESSGGIITQR
jgi:hypothetical protein